MITNPIQEVTEKLQSRAIGIICAKYTPNDLNLINKGQLKDRDGFTLDCVVLGKAIPIMKKIIDFEKQYFWIVYPRNKSTEILHLQIAGIWEPFTNKENQITEDSEEILKSLNLKDNYFSIRGQLIFVNSLQKELVIKVSMSKISKRLNNKPFKVTLKGEIAMEFVNSFVSINVTRKGNTLHMDSFELIEKKSLSKN